MKLNIGAGRDIKKGFINIDSYERENKLDMVIDVTKEWPFEKNKYDYIYAEQLIEHLDWINGRKLLVNCFQSLKCGGTLRLVLPDYRKIFQKYLDGDEDFFKIFFDGLNKGDYPYYCSVYTNPDKVKRKRIDNPPPDWHISPRKEDRERLSLRIRHYIHLIELVDWFVHQYGEHKCLYDFDLLSYILLKIGFLEIKQTNIIKGFDSEAPTRITSSIYIEAKK